MLKEITIESYKSLKNVTVQLKDGLNIIIGKNGSGKSNLLEFINDNANLKPFNAYPIVHRFISDYEFIYYLQDNVGHITIEIEVTNDLLIEANQSSQEKFISISIWKANKQSIEKIPFRELNWSLLNKLFKTDLSSLQNLKVGLIKYNLPLNLSLLNSHLNITAHSGVQINDTPVYFLEYNLGDFSFFHLLLSNFESSININENYISGSNDSYKKLLSDCLSSCLLFTNLEAYLSKITLIQEVRISPGINVYNIENKILFDYVLLEFKVNDSWVPWSYLSDGTKRLFYLISQICSQKDGLILIEEPELGIHPHQLYKLMQFIKEQSEEKQIIVSTHSPVVLDCLNSDELDRIIIAEIKNGSSQFRKMDEAQKEKGAQYMNEVAELSYYWLHSDLEEND